MLIIKMVITKGKKETRLRIDNQVNSETMTRKALVSICTIRGDERRILAHPWDSGRTHLNYLGHYTCPGP